MLAFTVGDLGTAVREARSRQGMTQADLARIVGVSRDWVVRLEQGHPRLQAQLVLDALAAAGVSLDVKPLASSRPLRPEAFDDVLRDLTDTHHD